MPRLADGGLVAAVGHCICPGLVALGCQMHCILTFRSLPPAARAVWKTLLEHCVFDDEDPAAHIPADRRGILGPLTPEQLAGLRETIRRYL